MPLGAVLRLVRTEGIGPIGFRRLMQRFGGDAEAALDALPGLTRVGGRDAPPAVPGQRVADAEAASDRSVA